MAYKIRYGSEKLRHRSTLGLRTAVSLGILAGVAVTGQLWPEGREVLEKFLAAAPATALETATAEGAAAVTAGKGWAYALAAFAAGILS